MANASINIKKNSSSLKHNDRTGKIPKYLLPEEFRKKNEIDRNAIEAQKLLDDYILEAKENYKKNTGQKFQAKVLKIEAVVNLNENHTMQDMKNLTEKIEERFGLRAVQIAIHRDEGHIEKNEPIYNYHSHIVFCNLDKNGKTILKNLGRDGLRELQDLTANTLHMERGKSADITKVKHKTHQEYKREKLQEDVEWLKNYTSNIRKSRNELQKENEELKKLADSKDLQEENRKLRELLKENQANRAQYALLEAEMKELKEKLKRKELYENELKEKIEELNKTILNSLESKKEENQVNDILEQKEKELDSLKLKYDDIKKENINLKEENEALRDNLNIYQKLHSLLEDYMPKIALFMDNCLQKWSKDVDKNDIEEVLKEELGIEDNYTQKRNRSR